MHKIKVCLFRPKWGHLLLHITLALSNCRLLWKEITQCFCLHLASDVCPIFAPGLHNLKTQYRSCLAGHWAVEWDRGGAEQDWALWGTEHPTELVGQHLLPTHLWPCRLCKVAHYFYSGKRNERWTWPISSTSPTPPQYQSMRPGPWRWVGCSLTMLTPVSFPFPVAEDGPGRWGPEQRGMGHSVPMAILSQQWLFACKKVGVFQNKWMHFD